MPREDRNEWVEVGFDRLVCQTKAAIIVEVEGDEYPVGKSVIDNCDDLEEDLKKPVYKRSESSITVPRWLAVQNGWIDEE